MRFPEGSVALVTGASRGLGAATAIALAKLGVHVVLLARTQGGLEETDDAIRAVGGTATLLPMDLREGEQVDAIGPSLYQRFGRLDVLLHCAGSLGKLTPVAHIQPNDWADVMGVTMAATWRLIRTCDPLLRHGPAGRAVFVTDARAREPKAYWGLYGAAKAGMEHLVQAWQAELAITRVTVELFDPGPMRTRLRRVAFSGDDPARPPEAAEVAPRLAAACLPRESVER
ncbi:MAG: SDR family NAD(P)-dependent oxidoreductase [Rhodospirillales bacterium]|nr:SDR family NAD(P)-dependent oxidoreductase [Rhodospirillales bacterium]